MLLTKILFVILILICAAFYVMYVWDFALVLLIVMIALPIIMFVTTFIAKKQINAQFVLKEAVAAKNTSIPVQLCITNNSFFPIGKAEARIEYYNIFNNSISTFDIYMPIQARNSQRMTFQLSSKYCGALIIKTAYVCIFDPLRIFSFKISKDLAAEMYVLPEIHEIGGSVSETESVSDDSIRFSDVKPGDDPSEVFDLRQYSAGDKLNRIHWKLSSKKDEFIVKDYSLPIDCSTTLFIDLKYYDNSDYTLPVFDTLIETLTSLSHFLIDNARTHNIVYYDCKIKRFVTKEIKEKTDIPETIKDIVFSLREDLMCESPEAYFMSEDIPNVSSITYISSSADPKSMSCLASNVNAAIKNAVIVVKSLEQSANLQNMPEQLRAIPVVIGRISASIKDIEI